MNRAAAPSTSRATPPSKVMVMILWWARGGHGRVGRGQHGPILPERDHGFDLRKRDFAVLDAPS